VYVTVKRLLSTLREGHVNCSCAMQKTNDAAACAQLQMQCISHLLFGCCMCVCHMLLQYYLLITLTDSVVEAE